MVGFWSKKKQKTDNLQVSLAVISAAAIYEIRTELLEELCPARIKFA